MSKINGELAHMASLVAIVKQYIKMNVLDKRPINEKHINSLCFQFLEKPSGKYVEITVDGWVQTMVEKGVRDVKLLTAWSKEQRKRAVFANGLSCLMLCFWNDKTVTVWSKNWKFNREKCAWDVIYKEQAYDNPPQSIPTIVDPTVVLKEILHVIKQFAVDLNYTNFAACFEKAYRILIGKEYIALNLLPEKNQRLLTAANCAFVFGGIGSWDDSPLFEAQQSGLENAYNVLSDTLYQSILQAVMYAVNEW